MTADGQIVDLDLLTIKLVRRQLLANKYILCYDIEGRAFYISPEADKSSRLEWQGFWLQNEYYIYV